MKATTSAAIHDRLTLRTLNATLGSGLAVAALHWLEESRAGVATDAGLLADRFSQAGYRCGPRPLPGWSGWSLADGARACLLAHAPLDGPGLAAAAASLYHRGDPAQRRGVLYSLPFLPIGDAALPLLDDALRRDDTRLIRAALGPYAQAHLDQPRWRRAVLACLSRGIPLIGVAGLDQRRDAELAVLGEAFAQERRTAGRPVPDDVWLLTRPR
ncbi:EboA domain-containing protein [Streptomyces platensis]|uniref:EboA domain-containing protein n=1 Tax=Streptomyces platensis TaxID=58346 RepID=UPI0036B27A89